MKKVLSIFLAFMMIFSSISALALDIDEAYEELKEKHGNFVSDVTGKGISESTLKKFVKDSYKYLTEIDSVTPITEANFEKYALQSITDVSSRQAYISLQNALYELYPDAVALAIGSGKVADEFKPLVSTIKTIYFREEEGGDDDGGSPSGPSGPSGPSSGPSSDNDDKEDDKKDEPAVPEVPEVTKRFNDLEESHWAFEAINYLADNFILNGYLDATFKPENNITRAEFAKIIISATDSLDMEAASSFSDVSSDHWSYSHISTAYKLGYITGYPDGTFKPDANITRADICTIVNRVLKAKRGENSITFTDADAIPDYAKEAVYALAAKGIVNGYADGTFLPTAFATRAQTAKIIYATFFKE